METAVLVLLFLIIWISLHSQIGKVVANTEMLKKEIANLKKQLEKLSKAEVGQKETEPVAPIKPVAKSTSVEEWHLPVLSVEVDESPCPSAPVAARPERPKKERKPINYEKYIGENLFGKIGILILVVGMGLFVKYAIDKEWINELFRTCLGFLVGGGLLLISGKLRHTYRTFSSLLAGGAFAIFYVTVAMAYHYYGLFNQAAAFILLVLLMVLMSLLAVWYGRRELAIFALLGGFIAPFLVSNGIGNYLVLFVYLSILNIGMFGLSLYKKWGELPITCFGGTYLILIGYVYAGDVDLAGFTQLLHLILFSTFFYLTFLLPVISIIRTDERKINQLLMGVVVLNNFIYLFFCLWFIDRMELVVHIKGIFPLFIALMNTAAAFFLWHRKEESGFLSSALLGVALTFFSIAIPIQLNGTFITLLWACEMLILLWLFTKWKNPVYEYFVAILFFLTNASYWIDIEKTFGDVDVSFLGNGMFATGIFAGLSFLLCAWFLMHNREWLDTTAKVLKYNPFNAIMLLDGGLVLYIAFMIEFKRNISDWHVSQGLMMTFTAVALFVAFLLLKRRFPMERYFRLYAFLLMIPVGWYTYVFVWRDKVTGTSLEVFGWMTLAIVAAHVYFLVKEYFAVFNFRSSVVTRMTCYFCILSTLLLVLGVRSFLYQSGFPDESNAGFSISLAIAGFIEMAIGMRLHLKPVRMVSLCTFGIVLLKLVLVDLWLLPTIGKIIIFIILGIILLVLSFLYQKLKKVLFGNDAESVEDQGNPVNH